jgi:3-deoxy-manno-octulosonate cytidylyltransferase (CMP-KDO synthetase)
MVEWVWRRASRCKKLREVWVVTDSDEVFQVLAQKKIPVMMSGREHESGTDRLAEAVNHMSSLTDQDWVVNLQGDEPLLDPTHLQRLIDSIEKAKQMPSPHHRMGTLVTRLTAQGFSDPNTVKAILDDQGFALYFTRAPAPFTRKKFEPNSQASDASDVVYKHLGVYAYEVSFLKQFALWPKHALEEAEGLEQLRALAHGHRIKCEFVDQPQYEFAGRRDVFSTSVDTQEDLDRVRAIVEAHHLWP